MDYLYDINNASYQEVSGNIMKVFQKNNKRAIQAVHEYYPEPELLRFIFRIAVLLAAMIFVSL